MALAISGWRPAWKRQRLETGKFFEKGPGPKQGTCGKRSDLHLWKGGCVRASMALWERVGCSQPVGGGPQGHRLAGLFLTQQGWPEACRCCRVTSLDLP